MFVKFKMYKSLLIFEEYNKNKKLNTNLNQQETNPYIAYNYANNSQYLNRVTYFM